MRKAVGSFIVLLILLSALPVWAVTYYVAASGGSDSRTCAQSTNSGTPRLTITSGLSCLGSGDTLLVKAGTYAERVNFSMASGASGARTTLQAAPGETVLVKPTGSGTTDAVLEVTGHWKLVGGGTGKLIFDADTASVFAALKLGNSDSSTNNDAQTTHLRIEGNEFRNVHGDTSCFYIRTNSSSSETFHEVVNNSFHDCGIGGSPQWFSYLHGAYMAGSRQMIDGNAFYNIPSGHCAQAYGNGCCAGNDNVYKNNTFHNCGTTAFGVYQGNNNRVENNLMYDYAASGLRVVGSNVTVTNNTMAQSGNEAINCSGIGSVSMTNNIAFGGISGCTPGAANLQGSAPANFFVDPSAGNFHLQSSATSAINQGTSTNCPATDHDGVARVGACDIGAFEFGAPGPTAPIFTFAASSPVASGSPSTLTWSSVMGTGVTCVASVPLGGPDPNWTSTTDAQLRAGNVSGKASAPITGPRTYKMECTNSGGVTTRTASVTVSYSGAPGVLVKYAADAGTGTLVADTAGAVLVHDCTLNSAGWGTGIVGTFALSFNGARVCNGAAAADLRTPTQLGIALWMSSTGGSYQHLVSYASPTTGWGLWVGPDGSLHGYANLSSGFAALGTTGVDLRTSPPHHVGLTKDATAMSLWVDNVVVATLSASDPIVYSGTEALEIGASCGSTGSCDWYTGLIDQVYLANVAFTPAQMNGYYQERSGAIPPDFNFTATSPVLLNTPSTLSWSWNGPTTNVSCTPSMIAPGVDANWTTTAPATLLTTGSKAGVNLTGTVTYRMRCTHSVTNLSTTFDRTVTVGAPGAEVIAWYHADGTADDSGSHGFHGILTNGALATGAPIVGGQSFVFDGVEAYVRVPGNATLRPPAIGMTLWMNTATPPIDEGCNAIRMGNGYSLGWEQDGRVFCWIGNGPTTTSTASMLTGTNQMLSCGYDPASGAGIQLWIGQTPVLPSTVTSVAIAYSGSEDLTIGGNPAGMEPSGGFNCAGRIDDVKLVNYAWTQSDIDALFGGVSSSAGLSQTHSQYTVAHSAEGNWLGERDTDQVTLLSTPWGLRWSLHNASGATVAEHIRPFCRVNHLGTWGPWTELANSFGSFGLRYLTDSAVNLGTATTPLLPLDGFTGVPGIFLADTVDVTSPYDAAQQLSIPNGRQADQELRLEASSPPLVGGDQVQCQPRHQSGALLSGGYGVGDVNIRTLTLQGLGDAMSVQQGGVHQGGTTQ